MILTVGGKACLNRAIGASHIDCTVPAQTSGRGEVVVSCDSLPYSIIVQAVDYRKFLFILGLFSKVKLSVKLSNVSNLPH